MGQTGGIHKLHRELGCATRLILEDPHTLMRIMERRTGRRVEVNEEVWEELRKMAKGVRIIRSAELVAIAVKRGIIDWPYPKRELLRNMLYALKFSGCSISEGEILELLNTI